MKTLYGLSSWNKRVLADLEEEWLEPNDDDNDYYDEESENWDGYEEDDDIRLSEEV